MALAVVVACGPAAAVEIALTFDDLPAHSLLPPGETRVGVARSIVAALKAAHAPPVFGFVNGVQLEREPDSAPVLDLWRAAGFPLGNHTWSHPNLNLLSAADFEADIVRNEPVVAARMAGQDWRWLRYPFLVEGDTAGKRDEVRAFLARRGYHVASVTMSFDDYAWNEPYARCRAAGDEAAIADLEAGYLAAAEASLAYAHDLSLKAVGRDIPYVLLMHLGAFDARMAPRLLALYRAHGIRFVTLAQAEKDPFYAADFAAAPSPAALTLENAARARGLAPPPRTWDPAALDKVCRPAVQPPPGA
jgi:peptidoglycan/xylan/chitin deacetylase (PgdA/CDA1 family)